MDSNTRAFLVLRIDSLEKGILNQQQKVDGESNPWTRMSMRTRLGWLKARREEAEFILGILERAEG